MDRHSHEVVILRETRPVVLRLTIPYPSVLDEPKRLVQTEKGRRNTEDRGRKAEPRTPNAGIFGEKRIA